MNDFELLEDYEPTFLNKDRSGKGYICPLCNAGTGKNGTGIVRNPHNLKQWKCFSGGCGFSGDIVDLYKAHTGIQDTKKAVTELKEYFNVSDEPHRRKKRNTTQNETNQAGYEDFIEQCKKNNDYKYLLSRGISEAVQDRFNIGINGNMLIIPTDNNGYVQRSTGTDKHFYNVAGVHAGLFNTEAMTEDICFVVESSICAMSIEQAGYHCIGLNSANNSKNFTDKIEDDTKTRFIILLDNDEAGQKETKKVVEELQKREIPFLQGEYDDTVKDPNEYLQKSPEAFENWLKNLHDKAKQIKTVQIYNAGEELDFFRHIEEQEESIEMKTGFAELDRPDKNLYGGLHEGLYIIGAISSLGKTSFLLQLADQVADNGNDVLFFSLEQSRHELMAKSISRETYLEYRNAKDKDGKFLARDTMQILNNRRYKYYSPEEKEAIRKGIDRYSKYAGNINIFEGKYKGHALTVEDIVTITEKHIEETGKKPLVIVDYLQMVSSISERTMTEKQVTDHTVSELKDLSRRNRLPVFAISSFNRQNYYDEVNMTAFKESGSIEYSADVLFGLQFSGIGSPNKQEVEKIKTENARKKDNKEPVMIDLKCLKNRMGNTFSLIFFFTHAFNTFEQITYDPDQMKQKAKIRTI